MTIRPATPDEIREMDAYQNVYRDGNNQLGNSYIGAIQKTRSEAINAHEMSNTIGLSPDVVEYNPDTAKTLQNTMGLTIGVSKGLEQVSYALPALSSVLSSPNKFAATMPNVGLMGYFENKAKELKQASEFNYWQDRKDELSQQARYNPQKREQLTRLMSEYSKIQENYVPDHLSVPFETSKVGHLLTNMAKSTIDTYNTVRKEIENVTVPIGVAVGGLSGAPAGPIGVSGGLGLGYMAGKGAAIIGAVGGGAIELGLGLFNAHMMANASYQDQIAKGAPANQHTAEIANATGITLGALQNVANEAVAKFGLKTLGSIIPAKAIPFLESLGEKIPIFKHISDDIKLNPSDYVGKPLSTAIQESTGKFVKNFIGANAAAAGDLYLQNLGLNLTSNMSLIDSGHVESAMTLEDTLKRSTEGIGSALIGMAPLTGFMAGAGGFWHYRAVRDSILASDKLEGMIKSAKKNDNHSLIPDINAEFNAEVGNQHGITHIGIDIADADKTLSGIGLDTQAVFEKAGLGKVYQTAMDNGEPFAQVPIENFDSFAKVEIQDGHTIASLLSDSIRISDDVLTPNQRKEVVRIMNEVTPEMDQVIKDNRVELDEIKDIIKERLKTAMMKTGRSAKSIELEAETHAELTVNQIARLSAESALSISEVKDRVLPDILGPIHLEGERKSAVRTRIKSEMTDVSRNDPAYKVSEYRKSGRKIYIPKQNVGDFRSVMEAYPLGTFTTDKKAGTPWEMVASEQFDTTDMNEFIATLEKGKFHTDKELNSAIDFHTDNELEYNKAMSEKPKNGDSLGSVNPTEIKKTITLFKGSNQSTFVHEMAHIFLQVKNDIFKEGLGTDEFNQDWSVISEYLGVGKDQKSFTRKQQETFARGFEAYLKNGEAPSQGLRKVFSLYRKWMTTIYQNLKAAVFSRDLINRTVVPDREISALRADGWIIDQPLGINISPEMRGVFDRMLATQDEINQVRLEIGSNENWYQAMKRAGISGYVLKRLKHYSELGDEKAFRRLMNAQSKELESSFIRARKSFEKEQYRDDVDGTVANSIFQKNANVYFWLDMWSAYNKLSGEKNRDIAHGKVIEIARDILNGKKEPMELAGIDVYTDSKSIPEAAQKLIDSEKPSEHLKRMVGEAVQEKYPHMMDSADFHDNAMAAYHNIETLTAILSQHNALKAVSEQPTGEQILRDVILPDVKAEAIYNLKSEIQKAKLEKEAAIEKIKNDQILKDWAAKEKKTEKETRAKAEKLYEKMFKDIEYKDSLETLKQSAKVIKESQRRIVANMSIAAIKKATRELITIERTHSILSAKYLAVGNIEKAIDHKYQQVKAHAKLSEALKAQRKIDINMREVTKAKSANYAQYKAQYHFDAAYDLLHKFDIKHKDSDHYQGGTLKEWADNILQASDVPEWLLDENVFRDINSLIPEELQDFADTLKAIKHMANNEDKILVGNTWIDLHNEVKSMIEYATSNDKSFKYKEARQASQDKSIAKELYDSAKVGIISFQTKIKAFAANKDITDNPIFHALLLPFRIAADKYEAKNIYVMKKFLMMNKLVDLATSKDKMTEFTFKPGEHLSLYDVLGIALNWGTENNKKRFIDGHAAEYGKHWTEDYANRILDKHMTKEMWDYSQAFFDLCEETYPEQAATHERIEGFAPIKEPAIKIKTPYGTYAGGYAPLLLSTEFTNKALTMQAAAKFADFSNYHETTSSNRMKSRSKGSVKYVNSIDPMKLQGAVLKGIRDSYYREPLLSASRLVNNQEFKNLWRSKYGEQGINDLGQLFEYLKTNGLSINGQVAEYEKILIDPFVKARTVGSLAYAVGASLQDLTSFFFMAPRYLGVKGTIKAAKLMAVDVSKSIAVRTGHDVHDVIYQSLVQGLDNPRHYTDIIAKIENKSQFMKTKFSDGYSALYKFTFEESLKDKKTWLNSNLTFGFFHWSQLLQEIPVWDVTYERAMTAHGNEAKAIALADATIAEVFGSTRPEDRIKLLRQTTGWKKAINMFQSWTTLQAGNLWLETQKFKQGSSLQRASAVGYVMAFLFAMPLAGAWMSGSRKRDDESLAQWAAYEGLNNGIRFVPIVGPMVSRYIAEKVTGRYDPKAAIQMTSAFNVFSDVGSAMTDSVKLMNGDQELEPTLENWTKAMSAMPGVPWTNEIQTLFWNFKDILDGDMEFRGTDLMRRRPKSKRE